MTGTTPGSLTSMRRCSRMYPIMPSTDSGISLYFPSFHHIFFLLVFIRTLIGENHGDLKIYLCRVQFELIDTCFIGSAVEKNNMLGRLHREQNIRCLIYLIKSCESSCMLTPNCWPIQIYELRIVLKNNLSNNQAHKTEYLNIFLDMKGVVDFVNGSQF